MAQRIINGEQYDVVVAVASNGSDIAGSSSPIDTSTLAKDATLTQVRDRLPNSKWFRLQNADDLAIAITYLDAGTADERINTITYSSASLVISVLDTYSYAGTAGLYRLTGTVRS